VSAMLEIKALNANYGDKRALRDISLEVEAGELVAIIGPNGAGKSTLIKAASGLLQPVSGQVMCGGRDIAEVNEQERAKLISVVPQAANLGGAFTVEQTVALGRTAFMGWLGMASQEDKRLVEKALRETSMKEFSERRVAELSGGEQQRVLVARALAQNTPVMLLDEPTNHLDLQHQAHLLGLVRSLADDNGLAVLMAMHDLNLVSLYADRVAMVVDGELKALGTAKKVLTVKNIKEAYRISVDVFTYPKDGRTLILPT
jgi:iron complex transport system ATP-binding protein